MLCVHCIVCGKKRNESGFRPRLCTYRLNWARRTSWGWWDDWEDTVLQTQDSKFEPWRSESEHATSRSRRLPTILTFTRGWGRNIFVFFKPPRPGTEPRTLAWKAAVLTTTLEPPPVSYVVCYQTINRQNCSSKIEIPTEQCVCDEAHNKDDVLACNGRCPFKYKSWDQYISDQTMHFIIVRISVKPLIAVWWTCQMGNASGSTRTRPLIMSCQEETD